MRKEILKSKMCLIVLASILFVSCGGGGGGGSSNLPLRPTPTQVYQNLVFQVHLVIQKIVIQK